jgi:hypothetical protein
VTAGHPPPGQHVRRYRAPLIEAGPPFAQAVAALAAGLAISFAGRRFVPDSLVWLVVLAAVLLLLVTSVWGWQARKDLIDRTAVGSRPNRSQRPMWVVAQLALLVIQVGGSAVIFALGMREAPSYATAYDTQDPDLTNCDDSAGSFPGDDQPAVLDSDGRRVGYLELRRSAVCNTVWVRLTFDAGENARLIGGEVRIITARPADKAANPYLLPIKTDSGYGYGNMLSNASVCVQATVAVRQPDESDFGPATTTQCR